MLKIRRSKSADTRSAEHEVTKEELLYSSEQHIGDVRQAMRYFAERLLAVAEKHDWTKIDGIDQFHKTSTKFSSGAETSKNFRGTAAMSPKNATI